jgi:hypothetical protein
MHINKIFLALFTIPVVMLILPSSCSKTGYTIINTTADSASQIITANDELNISYELDQVVNESLLATTLCNIAGGDTSTWATGNALYTTISGAIIDTSHINDSSQITITYFGKNGPQTKGRTGTATIHFTRDNNGKIIPWGMPGAMVNINFYQYEVIVLATNVSVWINGSATITNTSGGLLKRPANVNLTGSDSLQDKVDANIIFTYNDNTSLIQTWTWLMTQTRVFNVQNSLLTSTIRGDSTAGVLAGVSTSGTTRLGNGFNTQITIPVVQTMSPGLILSNPISGEKVIHGIPEPVTLDYGVSNNGTPTPSSPYGYKMTWIHNGGQAVTIVPY